MTVILARHPIRNHLSQKGKGNKRNVCTTNEPQMKYLRNAFEYFRAKGYLTLDEYISTVSNFF